MGSREWPRDRRRLLMARAIPPINRAWPLDWRRILWHAIQPGNRAWPLDWQRHLVARDLGGQPGVALDRRPLMACEIPDVRAEIS